MNVFSPRRVHWRLIALLVLLAVTLGGCASTAVMNGEEEAQGVLRRLSERRESVRSAIYRVRWRAVGTEPHAEFILEIAYKQPGRFRIVATGPFGLPAFTAVVLGDDFTFVNHRDGRFITDDLANLIDYEFPVAEFFEGPWRDLFAGGWGGSREVESLTRHGESNHFLAKTHDTEWDIEWNRGKQGPSRISARVNGHDGVLRADVWFSGHDADRPPYWRIDRLVLKGVENRGVHRWSIIQQDFNKDIPDRLFAPLSPPPDWERERD